MLVLSRRPQEKIVFPHLNIEVEILGVSGNTVRVGVNAPREVLVLRHEVAEKDAARAAQSGVKEAGPNPAPITIPAAAKTNGAAHASSPRTAPQPTAAPSNDRNWIHQLRNYLNTAGLAMQVAQSQMSNGDLADAEAKLQLAMAQLNALDAAISTGPAVSAEAARPSDPVSPVNPPKPVNAPPTESHHKPLALVVEDNANESALLACVLRLNGFRVDTATDGCHALDYLATHRKPDVVLLDMRMPRCDGPTTISKIRSNPQLSDLRVVAVSGYRSSELGVGTGPLGVDRWFCKPVDPRRLVNELKHDLHVPAGSSGSDKGWPHSL